MRPRLFIILLIASFLPKSSWAETSVLNSHTLSPAEFECFLDEFHREQVLGPLHTQIGTAVDLMAHQMRKNFRRNGAVLAAEEGVNPDYSKATWIRDSAHVRTMEVLLHLDAINDGRLDISDHMEVNAAITRLTPDQAKQILATQMPYIHYLRATQDAQAKMGHVEPDPNDPGAILDMTLGEPRFRVTDGGVIVDENGRPIKWGRTQNDSPGHAARYLALISRIALKADKTDWVARKLFDGTWPTSNGILKRYAEYIAGEGRSHLKKTVEAWEEKRGNHYDTAVTQADALFSTAGLVDDIATRQEKLTDESKDPAVKERLSKEAAGNRAASEYYRKTANDLMHILENWHWDHEGFLKATIDPEEYPHPEKTIQRDALTINGIMHSQPLISLSDEKVLSTVAMIEDDNAAILPPGSVHPVTGVVPISRYRQDVWAGTPPQPGENLEPGHYPWTLLTATWLRYYATLTRQLERSSEIDVTPINIKFYKKLDPTVSLGKLDWSSPGFMRIMKALHAKTDGYGELVLKIVGTDGVTGEGFDPNTLAPKGPRLLSWNSVEIIYGLKAWQRLIRSPIRHSGPMSPHTH